MRRPMAARAMMPPTTPPATAPVFTELFGAAVGGRTEEVFEPGVVEGDAKEWEEEEEEEEEDEEEEVGDEVPVLVVVELDGEKDEFVTK